MDRVHRNLQKSPVFNCTSLIDMLYLRDMCFVGSELNFFSSQLLPSRNVRNCADDPYNVGIFCDVSDLIDTVLRYSSSPDDRVRSLGFAFSTLLDPVHMLQPITLGLEEKEDYDK